MSVQRKLRILGLSAVAVAVSGIAEASPPMNRYYSYRDEDGKLHVSNRAASGKKWKLMKELPAEGNRTNPYPTSVGNPSRISRTNLSYERRHRYDSYIRASARRYDLPESLVRAVIHTESRYNPNAYSRAGAMGLMQLMPSSAKRLGVADPFDPAQNIEGGCKGMRRYLDRWNGDVVLMAASYNAGYGAVKKYGGVPPYEETQKYVRAILRRWEMYQREEALGQLEARRGPMRHVPD